MWDPPLSRILDPRPAIETRCCFVAAAFCACQTDFVRAEARVSNVTNFGTSFKWLPKQLHQTSIYFRECHCFRCSKMANETFATSMETNDQTSLSCLNIFPLSNNSNKLSISMPSRATLRKIRSRLRLFVSCYKDASSINALQAGNSAQP